MIQPLGSYVELQTQLTIAVRLGFLEPYDREKVEMLASEVGKMLSAILNKLRSPSNLIPKL
jgi:four helix bundle protein